MSWKPQPRDICPKCNKAVYHNEAKIGAGQKWHSLCFKCSACNKMLESTNVSEHEGNLYCSSCYGRNFGIKGYGYGVGAGILSTDTGYGVSPIRNAPTEPVITGGSVHGGCPRCGKRVYLAEKKVAVGRDWHSSCFNCANCHKSLDSTTVNDNDGEIYCKTCYSKQFGPKGVGYGLGAGILQSNS